MKIFGFEINRVEKPRNQLRVPTISGGNDDEYYGRRSTTRFTPEQALQVPTVAAALQALSGAVSQMRIKLRQEFRSGDITPYRKPMLDVLFNIEPSPKWSASSFWAKVVREIYLYGNSYALIERPVGADPTAFIPININDITVEDNGASLSYTIRRNGSQIVVGQEQVLHFHSLDFDGVRGKSFLETGGNSMLQLDGFMYQYVADYYQIGTQQDKILVMKDYDAQQIEAVETKYRKRYAKGNNSRATPMIFNQEVQVQENGSFNLQEQQLIESRKDNRVELAKTLGVPPSVIGMEGPNTAKSIAEIGSTFVRYGLQPLLTQIEGEINRKVFRLSNYNTSTTRKFVQFDTMTLTRGTQEQWTRLIRDLVGQPGGVGIITRNEARTMLGFPRMAGERNNILSDGGPNNIPVPPQQDGDDNDSEDREDRADTDETQNEN